MRSLRIDHPTVPLLLLAVAAAALTGGPARADGGTGFQYAGRDDRIHGPVPPKGCAAAEGGGARAVTNGTSATARLHRDPGCSGPVVAVLRPGALGQVGPYFDSVRFEVTG